MYFATPPPLWWWTCLGCERPECHFCLLIFKSFGSNILGLQVGCMGGAGHAGYDCHLTSRLHFKYLRYFQEMTICWIKSEFSFQRKKGHGQTGISDWMCTQSANKPKTNSALQLSVYILRKEEINQSQTSISVCIPLAAHVCQLMKSVHGSPVIDFREALICRLRSGSSFSLPFSSLPPSTLTIFCFSLPTHTQTHTHTHILMCNTVMPWAAYWALAAALGESCRAKCLVRYLKSLDMINNVLSGALSHQTAHHKHISPGNYRFTFSHTFTSAILDWTCLSKELDRPLSGWTFGGLKKKKEVLIWCHLQVSAADVVDWRLISDSYHLKASEQLRGICYDILFN